MAQCVLSPQEFVQNAFNPVISVLCTPKVESVCQKNNLSFVDLIQPFCKLNAEVHLRDPTNQSYPIKSLRLNLVYMNDEAPKQMEARKMLYDVVSATQASCLDRSRTIDVENYSLQINNSTPWFETYREWYLKVAPISDHEFTGHFLAFIMVVSADDEEAMIEFAKMSQEQHNHQFQNTAGKVNKWFFSNPLKYYVLVQDIVDHDQTKTEYVFQNMKTTYGANSCCLLRINSRDLLSSSFCFQDPQSNLPDPWSQFLARRPTFGPEGDEFNFTTPSPVEDLASEGISADISKSECVEHPLMSPRYHKQSLSSVAIELDDEMDNSLHFGQLTEEKVANLTLNSESFIAEPEPLSVGGRKPGNALPHGACLTSDDTDRIRLFMQEFSMRALLPYIERQMSVLNEQVTNRKGLHRSFFSATKKWFGANKTGPAVGSKAAISAIVYSPDSVELQVRHLGDLAFMFQHYELAYQAYHSIKRDFNSDQAWMHYSGALEMAALSVFMQGSSSQRQVPFHYLDTAANIYLNTCKSNVFATRATLLATDCLKHYDRYLEAANYFVRLTSEESDLRSALLLEQAAHCHLNLNTVNTRKYAFYIILAGHRFCKAGQKKHALRCYQQALQVYQGKQWTLAEDHINLTTGRLSFTLNQLEDAIDSFYKLLYDGSLQGVTQQMYYLREYLVICSHWIQRNENVSTLPRLSIPLINAQESILLLDEAGNMTEGGDIDCDFDADTSVISESVWCQLEEGVILKATGSLPVTHRPMLQRYTNTTDNSKHPLAIVGEPVTLLLPIRNPLNIPLMVTDVHLIWSFQIEETGKEVSFGEPESLTSVDTKVVPEVAFNGQQVLTIRLSVIPLQTGQLRFQSIAFNLKIQNSEPASGAEKSSSTQESEIVTNSCVTVRGVQPLTVKGNRLNTTKEERCGVVYSQDLRLEPSVLPVMPKLKVRCKNFQKSLFCGQVHSNVFEMENCGSAPVKQIFVATTTPDMLTFGLPSSSPLQPLPDVFISSSVFPIGSIEHSKGVFEIPLPSSMHSLPFGGKLWLPFWVQGPQQPGTYNLNLLVYYDSLPNTAVTNQRARYRTLRLSVVISVSDVFSACAIAITGPLPVGKDLKQNVTVAVEASNIGPVASSKTIKLLQISCASRQWAIERLENSSSEIEVINPKQSLRRCFRAVIKDFDDQSDTQFSDLSFISSQCFDSSKCPCSNFYMSAIKNLKTNKKESEQEEQFVFCLILLWQCEDETKNVISFGQHHIFISKLDAVHFTCEEKALEEKHRVSFISNTDLASPGLDVKSDHCLRYYLFSPGEVKHDFSKSRACIVPVFLVLYNDSNIDIDTEVDANRLLNNSNPSSKREVCRFAWIGLCQTTLRLKCKESKVLRLQGCFFYHGAYSLNVIGITAKPCSEINGSHCINVKGGAQLQMISDSSSNYDSQCL